MPLAPCALTEGKGRKESLCDQCPLGETPLSSHHSRPSQEQLGQDPCDSTSQYSGNYCACSTSTNVTATYHLSSANGYGIGPEEYSYVASNVMGEYSQDQGLPPDVGFLLIAINQPVCPALEDCELAQHPMV